MTLALPWPPPITSLHLILCGRSPGEQAIVSCTIWRIPCFSEINLDRPVQANRCHVALVDGPRFSGVARVENKEMQPGNNYAPVGGDWKGFSFTF